MPEIHVNASTEAKIIVGGIIARYKYDHPDLHFMNAIWLHPKPNLIAHLVLPKCGITAEEGGIQVFSAMYSLDCPTFLFTQKRFKSFTENRDRKAVLAFPYNDNQKYSPLFNSSRKSCVGISGKPETTISFKNLVHIYLAYKI